MATRPSGRTGASLPASPKLLAREKGVEWRRKHTWGNNVMAGDGENFHALPILHLQVKAKATALVAIASGTNTPTKHGRTICLRKRTSHIGKLKVRAEEGHSRLANLHSHKVQAKAASKYELVGGEREVHI